VAADPWRPIAFAGVFVGLVTLLKLGTFDPFRARLVAVDGAGSPSFNMIEARRSSRCVRTVRSGVCEPYAALVKRENAGASWT